MAAEAETNSRFRITYRGRMFTKVKGWPAAIKGGLGGAIVDPFWKDFLPQHFQPQAYFRYGSGGREGKDGLFKMRFRRRTYQEYLADLKSMGKTGAKGSKRAVMRRPMVWTGALERSVLGIQPRISGSAKSGVRGYLRGSNVANFHTGNNPQTGGYNMIAELRVVNEQEEKEMTQQLDLTLTAFLNEKGAQEVKEV